MERYKGGTILRIGPDTFAYENDVFDAHEIQEDFYYYDRFADKDDYKVSA